MNLPAAVVLRGRDAEMAVVTAALELGIDSRVELARVLRDAP